MIAVRVLYSGQVQGVGFRASCARYASGLAVTGWVRNLPTGQVELVAEGEPAVVEAFLERIAGGFRGRITTAQHDPTTPSGFTNFEIRPTPTNAP